MLAGVSPESLGWGHLRHLGAVSSSLSSEWPWAEGPLCPADALALFPQDTFARAKNWVKELQRQASPNIVIALAGNKADLASKRAVEFQVGDRADLGGGRAGCTRLPQAARALRRTAWVVVGELLSESPHGSSTA